MSKKQRKQKSRRSSKQVTNAAQPVKTRGEKDQVARLVEIEVELEDPAFDPSRTEKYEGTRAAIADSGSEVPQIEVAQIERSEKPLAHADESGRTPPTVAVKSATGIPADHLSGLAEADRRAHPRYAFTADIELATADGAQLKTRVRDLSEQGCYVDTDSPLALGTVTEMRMTKGTNSFEARARVVYNQMGKGMGLMFTSVQPEQFDVLELWIVESRETSWLAVNRRRSHRVLMKIPVRVSSQPGAAIRFEETTHTVAISAHGASLVIAAAVQRGQQFTLSNIRTRASLECVVVHVERFSGGPTEVGAEFMLPNPTFWRVAFPPKDWTPRHPDAKSR